jgi:aminoglycoside 3-N-acetyltransferase I
MLTVFGEAFEDVERYSAARPSAAYLERLLESDSFIALAALKGDEVVAGIAALYEDGYAARGVALRYWKHR